MYVAVKCCVYFIPLKTYFSSALTYHVMLLYLYDFLLFSGETNTESFDLSWLSLGNYLEGCKNRVSPSGYTHLIYCPQNWFLCQ